MYIIQSDTTSVLLNYIRLYFQATCFGTICRPMFRLIFRQVESTILQSICLKMSLKMGYKLGRNVLLEL